MDDFVKVNKEDPKVRVQINDILERFNKLSLENQLKKGYDTLIQNLILTELMKIMGTTRTDLDIKLKLKNSREKYLESKTNSQIFEEIW